MYKFKCNAKYGLDKPLHIQFKNYIVKFVQGDFGVSLKMQKNRPVSEIIAELFPTSAKIGLISLLFAIITGIPMGCLAAYYRGGKVDSITIKKHLLITTISLRVFMI